MEIYPMPGFPTLSVKNLGHSGRWYEETLGFSHVFAMQGQWGEPTLVHLRWRKYADLLLVKDTEERADDSRGHGVQLSFLVENVDLDHMAEQLRERDVTVLEGPVDRPWNVRELIVADPDGYRLCFFKPIDTSLTMDDVLGGMQQSEG